MGGDGLATPIFIQLASPEISEGTYTTMVGGDTQKMPTAQQFVKDYESRYGLVGQWSAYGFDSANILIAAIQKAGGKDRSSVLKAMREIPSFAGVTGDVIFDSKGDNQDQFIGVFKMTEGKFVYVGQAE